MKIGQKGLRRSLLVSVPTLALLFFVPVVLLSASASASGVALAREGSIAISLEEAFYYKLCVTINGVSSTTSGSVTNATQSWGDGSSTYGTQFPFDHVYGSAGTYKVVITFVDSDGEKARAFKTVKITDPQEGKKPNLQLDSASVTGLSVSVGGNVNADQCGTETPPQPHWTWGDGSSSDSYFPGTHTYAESGTYKVCVEVYDTLGLNATHCESATVGGGT